MATQTEATFLERLRAYLFYFFPHHWLSRLSYYLARIDTPLKDPLVHAYIRFFSVDMEEAEASHVEDYPSFNDFFTRALKPGARIVQTDPKMLVSPCDGEVTQIGDIEDGMLLQAKGRHYELEELLGGTHPRARENARAFARGKFCSIYLSPGNCHRVHAPTDISLESMTHIPGRLFSVANHMLRVIPRLYLRNERVACIFDSDLGRIAIVMVGALNVGSIETTWNGAVAPRSLAVTSDDYLGRAALEVKLKRGEELGQFNFGSCVIVITSNPELNWNPAYTPGKVVRMGEELGCLINRINKDDASEQDAEPAFKPINPHG